MNRIGEKLVELRKAKNLSQKELSNLIHVSDKVISKWERNVSIPDVDMIVALCDVFEIGVEEFLGTQKKSKPVFTKTLDKSTKKTLFIAGAIFICVIAFLTVFNLIIQPRVFKNLYINELDNYTANSFSDGYFNTTQTNYSDTDGYYKKQSEIIRQGIVDGDKVEYCQSANGTHVNKTTVKNNYAYTRLSDGGEEYYYREELKFTPNSALELYEYYSADSQDISIDLLDNSLVSHMWRDGNGYSCIYHYRLDLTKFREVTAFTGSLATSPSGTVTVKNNKIHTLTLELTVQQGNKTVRAKSIIEFNYGEVPVIELDETVKNHDSVSPLYVTGQDFFSRAGYTATNVTIPSSKTDGVFDGIVVNGNFIEIIDNTINVYNGDASGGIKKTITSSELLDGNYKVAFTNHYVYGSKLILFKTNSYSTDKILIVDCETGNLDWLSTGEDYRIQSTFSPIGVNNKLAVYAFNKSDFSNAVIVIDIDNNTSKIYQTDTVPYPRFHYFNGTDILMSSAYQDVPTIINLADNTKYYHQQVVAIVGNDIWFADSVNVDESVSQDKELISHYRNGVLVESVEFTNTKFIDKAGKIIDNKIYWNDIIIDLSSDTVQYTQLNRISSTKVLEDGYVMPYGFSNPQILEVLSDGTVVAVIEYFENETFYNLIMYMDGEVYALNNGKYRLYKNGEKVYLFSQDTNYCFITN